MPTTKDVSMTNADDPAEQPSESAPLLEVEEVAPASVDTPMEIDQDFSQKDEPTEIVSSKKPNYGTKRYSLTVEPTIANPTNVAEIFEEFK